MAAHRYWRLYIDRIRTDTVATINEIALLDSGASVISGGTWTASSTGNGAVANALDGSDSTFWGSSSDAGYPNAGTQWLQYDAGSGNTVEPYKLRLRSRSGFTQQNPAWFRLQYSDDGSTWTDQAKFEKAYWGSLETRVFNVKDGDRYKIIYQLESEFNVTRTISEIELRGTIGGSDLTVPCAPGTGLGGYCFGEPGDQGPWMAFNDAVENGNYIGSAGVGQSIEWIFDGSTSIAQIAVSARVSFQSQAPSNMEVWRSTDQGLTWNRIAYINTAAAWTSGETKVFTLADYGPRLVASRVQQHIIEGPRAGSVVASRVQQHIIEGPPEDGPIRVSHFVMEVVRDYTVTPPTGGKRRRFAFLPG